MADGVRITQAGSSQQRTTQAGDRRITERAVLAGAVLSTAPGITVQVECKHYATVALTSAPHMTGTVNAERPGSTALQAGTQFFGATGRDRAACVCLNTTPDVQAVANRNRPVFAYFTADAAVQCSVTKRSNAGVSLGTATSMAGSADRMQDAVVGMAVQTGLAAVFATKASPVVLHLAADTTLTAGRDDPLIRRITEAGEIRRTQSPGIRIIEESPAGRDVIVVQPAYRIYTKWYGVWCVLDPHVKHAGQWQTPAKIFPKDGGLWLPVRSHLQE